MAKRPMMEIIFPLFPAIVKPRGDDAMRNYDDDMLTNNFDSRSEGELDIICNIVSILPI